jgi:hypothetical protein
MANPNPKKRQKRVKITAPIPIEPNAAYTFDGVKEEFKLTDRTLRNAIREGQLRVSRRGGCYWFLGSWLLEFFRNGETTRRRHPDLERDRPGDAPAGAAGVGPAARGPLLRFIARVLASPDATANAEREEVAALAELRDALHGQGYADAARAARGQP